MPENKLNFSWERFTEEDFNKKKNELLNKKDWNGPALIDVGAVNIELHDPEYSFANGEPRVFLDYYIGGDTSENSYSYGTDIPYGHADGSSIPISKIVPLSYEEFKSYLENEVSSEFNRINNAQNKILLEAERPTVNFDDPKQGAELYITKLAEKVDLAEQKDRRTWQFVRDNHPGYHDDLTIKSDQIFSDNDVYRSVVAGEMSVESAEKFVELCGTKADFAREFIRTEKEIIDDAIENWQPEEADEDGEVMVPGYVQEFYDVVNDCYDEMDKAVDIIDRENEKEEYIHSEEFIEKFGDWEKINRLEKLKNAPTLEKDGKIIINGTDYTNKVAEMRKNEDRKGLREIMSLLKNEIKGSYAAPDMDNESIDITSATMKELNRFPLNSRQIEATLYIPDLLKNGTFICNEKNEDLVTNPEIDHYSYLLNGIKIAGEDYTAKSVIAVAKDGKKYYDHKLSKIEKGRILNNLPLLTDRESLGSLPYDLKDNRLLRICQVPELPYLEMKNGKWRPTQEAIEKVKAGKLYIEQDKTQGFSSIVDESNADKTALDFRNEYNAQKAMFEPPMTYETARDVVAASGVELIGKNFDETNGKGVEVNAKLIFDRAYSNARTTPDAAEDFALSSIINFNNLTKQANKAHGYMNAAIEYVAGIPGSNSENIESKDDNISYLPLLKNADFEKCVERAKREFRNLIETSPAEEMSFNLQTFEYFKKNASVIFRSAKESLREFWKTVEETYARDDIEKEKDKFIKSLSGWELNTTLDIDDSKAVRQYFVYPNESLPGIRQDYDKDGNLVTDLRLVADIDDKTNELDHISIDRINSVTGAVDYDVQGELSNDGKKILHSAEKEIKEYLLNEFSEIMKKDGLSIDTGSPELTGNNLTHLSSKIVLQEILNVKDRTKEIIQEQNLEKLFDGKFSIDEGNSRMSFRETLDFYNKEDADRPYSERLNHAVSRMLYYSLYLPDDNAGEKRWQICDDVAEKITGGEIKQLFDGISSAQEIADKEAKEKFGYSWQEKVANLSKFFIYDDVLDPDGMPTDLDHMIHYFEENTPLEGHRRNLEKAVSHMLMFTIDDFRSLSTENYDDITQDGAAAELRGELCDRIANDLISKGGVLLYKEVEDYSKEIAGREIEKLKEGGRFVEAELAADRAVAHGESDFYSKNFTAEEKQKFESFVDIGHEQPEKLRAVLSQHMSKGSLSDEETSLIDKYLFTDVDCLRFDRDKGDMYLQRYTDDGESKFTKTSLKGVLEVAIENAENAEDAGAVLTLQKRLNELRGFNQNIQKSKSKENFVEKQNAAQEKSLKEDVFGDFVSKVEAEYKDLNLFLRSAANVLKQLPPEKKDEVRKELLKRGANTPEKLAVVMRNAIKAKQHTKSQQQKNPEKKRDDYGMER